MSCVPVVFYKSDPYPLLKSLFSPSVNLCVRLDVVVTCLPRCFQVNTSGQFVGLAEMVGRVDFNKTVEYWQQDKWTGCFPVKWHIVKDIPNSSLKHIILEYNENKPVIDSKDTQEVS